MTDWRDNPRAHEYTSNRVSMGCMVDDPVEGIDPDACWYCGESESAHDGSEIPLDQQMRGMGAPTLPGFGDV